MPTGSIAPLPRHFQDLAVGEAVTRQAACAKRTALRLGRDFLVTRKRGTGLVVIERLR